MITFSGYQQATNSTAIYPCKGRVEPDVSISDQNARALLYVLAGLAGEVGEVTQKVKKVIRDDGGVFTAEKVKGLGKEVGGCFWYFAQLCETFGLDMGEIAQQNLDVLASRQTRGVLGGSGDDR